MNEMQQDEGAAADIDVVDHTLALQRRGAGCLDSQLGRPRGRHPQHLVGLRGANHH